MAQNVKTTLFLIPICLFMYSFKRLISLNQPILVFLPNRCEFFFFKSNSYLNQLAKARNQIFCPSVRDFFHWKAWDPPNLFFLSLLFVPRSSHTSSPSISFSSDRTHLKFNPFISNQFSYDIYGSHACAEKGKKRPFWSVFFRKENKYVWTMLI